LQPNNNNTATAVPTLNYYVLPPQDLANVDLYFSIPDCTDSVDSCDDLFM